MGWSLGLAIGLSTATVFAACAPIAELRSVEALPTAPDTVLDAIALRQRLGMRSDEAYVRMLEGDPEAGARGRETAFGFAVTVAEAAELGRRVSRTDEVATAIEAYGADIPTWAGMFIDQPNGGIVVAQFTGDVEQHRAALARLLSPAARYEVRLVGHSLVELQALADRVTADRGWFRTVDSYFTGSGADQKASVVVVNVKSLDPDIAAKVIEHFDAAGLMRVVVSTLMPWTGGYGQIDIVAVDPDGRPVPDEYCWLITDDPAAWEEPPEVTGDEGTCHIRAGATEVIAQIRRETADGWIVLGETHALIPAGGTVTARITVREP
jgi:hypothetical protein